LKKWRKRDGLVFPAPEGGVDRHFHRIVENLAEMAGVEKPGVHKFRDTWATDLLRDSSVDIFTLRRWIGHQNLETLRLYAESLKAKDQRARNAANGQDKYLIADAAD
jgi:integrase